MKAFPLSNMAGLNQQGMDLRDYFAAKAMQEFISEMPLVWSENTIIDINIATKFAYKIADAMMEARK
jgi:dihydrodipicolinate reductase